MGFSWRATGKQHAVVAASKESPELCWLEQTHIILFRAFRFSRVTDKLIFIPGGRGCVCDHDEEEAEHLETVRLEKAWLEATWEWSSHT